MNEINTPGNIPRKTARRLRVLSVTNMYPTPKWPAFGTFVRNEVTSLRAAGVGVDVLVMNGRDDKWSYLRGLFHLWRALRRRKYDVIHAHYVLTGAVARMQWGTPVVLTHHGCEVLGYPLWQTWLAKLDQPPVRRGDLPVRGDAPGAERRGRLDHPGGIDLDRFTPIPRDAARAAIGLPLDRPLVLWAGEPWRPEKRFSLAAEAVELVKLELPDAELVVLNKKPHDVVPLYMSACDALVFTSVLEGSPNVVKEAMACNLPVVSVRVGDVPEVIAGTDGCTLADRDSADIARKLIDVLRRPRRTDGRRNVLRFSHEQIAAGIVRGVHPRGRSSEGAPCSVVAAPTPAAPPSASSTTTTTRSTGTSAATPRRWRGSGYDVTVIALQQEGQARHERVNGIEVYRLPLAHRRGSLVRYALEYGRLIGMAFLLLTRLHLQKRFQAIEIDNMPDVLVFSALIPKLLGAKVVLYLFDSMSEIFMLTRGAGPGHPAVRLLALEERISAAFADRVIVPHHPFRETVHAHGIPREKMTVVLNGPDDAIFTPRPPSATERDDGTFEIVTHGTILERFGIQVLIRALPRILERVPGARVTVYGEGEYRHALEALARQLGVADRVRFGGWVPVDDLPSVLSRFDVGYVGMLCDNMLSNKLMEYVALRLPVVAARWPTYQHYFDDACVAFFDAGSPGALADALVGVYHDRAAARQRTERAAERFEQYRWSVQRQAYLGVYESLAASAGARRPALALAEEH